uniref:PDEase domain-containing protein n=1 Tax=Parascaris univalens TaxID=6257 RepID=A0A915B5E2_PARUN
MAAELREETIVSYLRNHPHFLENYVTGPNISKETFHRWATRRSAKLRSDSRKITGGPWLTEDPSQRSALIGGYGNNAASFLFELACSCAQFVHTEQFEVYLHKDGAIFLLAREDDTVMLKRPSKVRKAPAHTQQLIDCAGLVIGEINFYRIISDRDRLAVSIICTWGCVAFYFAKQLPIANNNSDESNDTGSQQRRLNTFLLDVAKYDKINPFGISLIRSIFQDIVSMDTVIMKVMIAPRNSGVDVIGVSIGTRSAKYGSRADEALRHERTSVGGAQVGCHRKMQECRNYIIMFPAGKGIGGYVASTGQGLNIEDAYEDPRFNKEIDQKTGYKTRNILCMPIFIRGSVIGVVQMVNKNDGSFTKQDENSFETFAVYCGLALHHAKLYDRIKRSEQKYRVALEVLAYHSVCNKDEVNKLKSVKLRDRIVELETFDFNGMKLSELEKPLYAVYMFKSLFDGVIRYDYDDLVRFVLTVRKNYRRVAYHNWAHGWSVAHAMFVLLKITTIFSPKEDGHNILKSLSSDEYKRALSLIKHCILATDLALFFPNKARLSKIVTENSFDWQNNEHRALAQAVIMTGCDLIASAKPWSVQTETVKVIFEEFYEQGDAERMNGKEPTAMMDRQKAHELPQMQVGFMNGICMPCYELLSRVIPETDQLKERCRYNANKWEELAGEQKRRTEEATI